MTQRHTRESGLRSGYHRELDRVRAARRRRRRAGIAGACLALVLGTSWVGIVAFRPAVPGSSPVVAVVEPADPEVSSSVSVEPAAPAMVGADSEGDAVASPRIVRVAGTAHGIERVGNRPVGARVVVGAVPTRVVRISDAELLAAFDAIGDPVGIVRMEGVTTLARLTPREESRTP